MCHGHAWTGSWGAAVVRRMFGLRMSEWHLCFLQMTRFCRLLRSVSAPRRFAAECKEVVTRVSTSKSEAIAPCWKMMDCTLRLGDVPPPQTKALKYLGVFTSSIFWGHQQHSKHCAGPSWWRRSWARRWSFQFGWSKFQPLTYSHELWVVAERIRWQIQKAETSFLSRVAGVSLRDRVWRSEWSPCSFVFSETYFCEVFSSNTWFFVVSWTFYCFLFQNGWGAKPSTVFASWFL